MGFARAARWIPFCLLVGLLLLGADSGHSAPRETPFPLSAHAGAARQQPLPAGIAPVLATALAADHTADYAVMPVGDQPNAFRAANPAHHLTAAFLPDGIAITGDPDGGAPSTWGMRLATIGDGTHVLPVAAASPVLSGTRVEYRRGNVTEWYLNSPLGIEQGFTLAAPPTGDSTITLTLAVRGAVATPAGSAALFRLPSGGELRYSGLAVTDAAGHPLRAALLPDGGTMRITVDTRGAIYPITIDPLVQQAQLLPNDEATTTEFGYAVKVSDNGNTALVGATPPAGGQGNHVTVVAYVFVRSGTTWTQQQRLTNGSFFENPMEGDAQTHAWIALSQDGNTALLYHPNNPAVFVRANGVWSLQQLLPPGSGTLELKTVALSGDGNTAFIASGTQTGSVVFVYVRVGTTWTQQGTPLGPNGMPSQHRFGTSLGLAASTDGNTVVVGAPADEFPTSSGPGAAYVFIRNPTTQIWSQQTIVMASDGVVSNHFGRSIALSADGNTILIGAPMQADSSGNAHATGDAYVYVHTTGAGYTEQKIPGPGPCDTLPGGNEDQCVFGSTVALSGDASTAMIGLAGKFTTSLGAIYHYQRSGTHYQQVEVIRGQNPGDATGLGGLAANGDGTTILIGAPRTVISGHTGGTAYVYVLAVPIPLPPPQPTAPVQSAPSPIPIKRPTGVPNSTPPAPLPPPRP
ncbi:MAG: FG-GAP repeat protein [Thermomicrobiales bacterium]